MGREKALKETEAERAQAIEFVTELERRPGGVKKRVSGSMDCSLKKRKSSAAENVNVYLPTCMSLRAL